MTSSHRPVGSSLSLRAVGGRAVARCAISWDPWTYRLEVQVDDALPDEAWVALPPATVDGRDGLFPPVRFERRWQIAFARICGVT